MALLRLLLVLATLCLTACLPLLRLTALLGLSLLALSTLRLAGAALLVACSRRAGFGLRALGPRLAGGFAAHILSRRDGDACQQRSCAD